MKKFSLFILMSFSLHSLLIAQTPYPLTFFWQGEIENGRKFEALVSMIDSDNALNGKGSRLAGQLVFLDNWEHFELRGQAQHYEIDFNCVNDTGKILYSFRFKQTNGQDEIHQGEWTDGNKHLAVKMQGNTVKGFNRPLRDAFAEGVNFRAERLSHLPMLDDLEYPLLKKMGEGYLMRDSAFARVAHYGQTYISFREELDSLSMQLDWLLLRSSSLYLLETQQTWQDNQLKGLELKAWSYRAGVWKRVDHEIFPKAFLKDKKIQLPKTLEGFLQTSEHLVFRLKNIPAPLVLEWNRKSWQVKK